MQQGSEISTTAVPGQEPWKFPKDFLNEQSPSRTDNISLKKETSCRRLALAFGHDVGFLLKMNQYTIATAFVYWQRFFTVQSLAKNDPYLIAAACLLLAGKVEENFKSLQKITETAYFVRNKRDPKASEALRANQRLLLAEMDRVVKAEEVLLMTMNFEFLVSHPYRPLLIMVKELGFNKPSPDNSNTKFCQIAWNFANDSFRTTICLQRGITPEDLAATCLNLAATTLQVKIPPTSDGKPWFAQWDVKPEVVHDLEFQVMSLYKKKDGDSKTSPTSRVSLPATPSLQAASREPQATGTPSPTSPGEVAQSAQKQPDLSGSTDSRASSGQAKAPKSTRATSTEADAASRAVGDASQSRPAAAAGEAVTDASAMGTSAGQALSLHSGSLVKQADDAAPAAVVGASEVNHRPVSQGVQVPATACLPHTAPEGVSAGIGVTAAKEQHAVTLQEAAAVAIPEVAGVIGVHVSGGSNATERGEQELLEPQGQKELQHQQQPHQLLQHQPQPSQPPAPKPQPQQLQEQEQQEASLLPQLHPEPPAQEEDMEVDMDVSDDDAPPAKSAPAAVKEPPTSVPVVNQSSEAPSGSSVGASTSGTRENSGGEKQESLSEHTEKIVSAKVDVNGHVKHSSEQAVKGEDKVAPALAVPAASTVPVAEMRVEKREAGGAGEGEDDSILGLSEELMNELEDVDVGRGQADQEKVVPTRHVGRKDDPEPLKADGKVDGGGRPVADAPGGQSPPIRKHCSPSPSSEREARERRPGGRLTFRASEPGRSGDSRRRDAEGQSEGEGKVLSGEGRSAHKGEGEGKESGSHRYEEIRERSSDGSGGKERRWRQHDDGLETSSRDRDRKRRGDWRDDGDDARWRHHFHEDSDDVSPRAARKRERAGEGSRWKGDSRRNEDGARWGPDGPPPHEKGSRSSVSRAANGHGKGSDDVAGEARWDEEGGHEGDRARKRGREGQLDRDGSRHNTEAACSEEHDEDLCDQDRRDGKWKNSRDEGYDGRHGKTRTFLRTTEQERAQGRDGKGKDWGDRGKKAPGREYTRASGTQGRDAVWDR